MFQTRQFNTFLNVQDNILYGKLVHLPITLPGH